MPAFLVHGVPDTHRLWDEVRTHLHRKDVIAPSMPGFGTPIPDGFDCTKESYASWLTAEIERVGEPVDLVGHDWGSILVQRIVSTRPDLVRTWAAGGGPVDAAYEWHQAAKVWQTPGAGEAFMQSMTPALMVPAMIAEGVPEAAARVMAEHADDRMKSAILPLYRSAVTVGAEWEPAMASVRKPGMAIWGELDPYVPVEFGKRLAERTGAKLVVFEGCRHFWPHQRPQETAAALESLWAEA